MTKTKLIELSKLFTDNSIKAMVVPSEGKARQFTSIEQAVRNNQSFMVMPKPNLFIIDSDAETQTFNYTLFKNYCYEQELDFYEWNSGRPGHRHLVVAFQSTDTQQAAWDLIKRLKLDLRYHRATRPTLAPHRNNLPVSLVDGYTLTDVKRVLSRKSNSKWECPKEYTSDDVITLETKPIKSQTLNLIIHGPNEKCQDRSKILNQCAISLARSGYSIEAGGKILSDPKNKISKHILESRRTEKKQFEYGCLFMEKAHNFLKTFTGFSEAYYRVQQELQKINSFILTLGWKGQQGNSELSCLKAHIQAAMRAGSFVYGLSIREQELNSEVSIMTARKANIRLVEKGWIKKIAKHTENTSTVWQLSIPEGLTDSFTNHDTSLNAEDCANFETLHAKGVFRTHFLEKQKGLGKSAGRIYSQIMLGSITVKDLRQNTGLSRATVQRALKRLREAEMITNDNSLTGWVPENMLELASNKENAIRSRQQREREIWKESHEEYQIRRYKMVS